MESDQTDISRAHPAYAFENAIGRRRLLQFMAGSAAFVGFTMLGLFRGVPKAGAYSEYEAGSAASYCGNYDPDTWSEDPSTQNGYWDAQGCQNGACVGTSMPYEMGRAYCSTCDEVSASNPNQWHHSGSRPLVTMGDVSNVCDPLFEGAKDAWRWKQSSCGSCAPAVWRCHDGWKMDPSGLHGLTICQGLVYCNDEPFTGCNELIPQPPPLTSDLARP